MNPWVSFGIGVVVGAVVTLGVVTMLIEHWISGVQFP